MQLSVLEVWFVGHLRSKLNYANEFYVYALLTK